MAEPILVSRGLLRKGHKIRTRRSPILGNAHKIVGLISAIGNRDLEVEKGTTPTQR